MNRTEMIGMLHALDAELTAPLKIVITGASALIIRGCIARSSNDIDILGASEPLNQGSLKEILMKIAATYNLKNDWIDTRPEEVTFRDLPGYKPDLQKLDGNFRYLQPYIISKADSVLTKFAYFSNIRQWDRNDIRATDFSEEDFKSVWEKLFELSKKDPERALRIEIEFKSVKPQIMKTEEGFSFSNSEEIARYAAKRHGIILDKDYKTQLDDAVLNLRTSYQKAIIDIDNMALEKILKIKTRDADHELDL